jgi:hypothetical protein
MHKNPKMKLRLNWFKKLNTFEKRISNDFSEFQVSALFHGIPMNDKVIRNNFGRCITLHIAKRHRP